MKGRFLFLFALAGLAFAGTKSYTVTLYQPSTIGNTELRAGSYKVEVMDQKAIIHNGKTTSEVPVKVEANDSKYAQTTVRFSTDNGKYRVQEIHLGGTNTKLVLDESATSAAGQ
jgi:hypothetical protein